VADKKVGRPTDNPKTVSLHVRLDKECADILQSYAEQKKVTKVEAVRRGIKKLEGDLQKRNCG
jgi:hypothetical protein